MKYAIIIPDGCADEPQESLGGKTPLEAARVPAMDAVAAAGVVGRANNTPETLPPGSDVANLSLLGYNPLECFTGRAAIEAAAQGIALGSDDWAIRCNLVTVEEQVMKDFTAGHISSAEAGDLLRSAQEKLACDRLEFHPGVSYRNLLLYRGAGRRAPFSADTRTTPPHDLTDKTVIDDYPRGPGSDLLNYLMSESVALFAEHPVNVARRAAGKPPATNIWLWGLGSAPQLRPFVQRYGKQGAMIAAVDLLRGLAALIGWRRIDVPGATGYLDTDYAAKGRNAVQTLDEVDLVCVHVEATDEASHEGNATAKVAALEEIDRHIVGPLHEALKRHGEYRILVTPDHPTPLRTKTHSHGFVPFALAGSDVAPDSATVYDDPTAGRSSLVFAEGWRLMEFSGTLEGLDTMRISVVGAGYVGLVTGTCLAETGNDVICVDCDRKKIEVLNRGHVPIYEPGLAELIARNVSGGRLQFTCDMPKAVQRAQLVFLAVGTPSQGDGSVDLSALWAVVDQLAPHIAPTCIIVLKSTVPVGTNAAVAARLKQLTGREVDVVSNPEFLKEGVAIDDFMKPDRVVIGARRQEVLDVLGDLYQPYLRTDKPLLSMSPESAEMTKYVANALLSTKISFINEMANLCEGAGADINEVRRGIGHDSRIGFAFLFPGVGYGGSCFPKDVRALAALARTQGVEPRVLEAVHAVNENQKRVLVSKIERHFGGELSDKAIAIWGLAFKPGTDDIREAPSLVLIDRLLELKATIRVYDPEAMQNVRALYGDRVVYCQRRDDAILGADALAICTEWKQFLHPDFEEMRRLMRQPVIFDGRNLYNPTRMRAAGFSYYSIGRPDVDGDEGGQRGERP